MGDIHSKGKHKSKSNDIQINERLNSELTERVKKKDFSQSQIKQNNSMFSSKHVERSNFKEMFNKKDKGVNNVINILSTLYLHNEKKLLNKEDFGSSLYEAAFNYDIVNEDSIPFNQSIINRMNKEIYSKNQEMYPDTIDINKEDTPVINKEKNEKKFKPVIKVSVNLMNFTDKDKLKKQRNKSTDIVHKDKETNKINTTQKKKRNVSPIIVIKPIKKKGTHEKLPSYIKTSKGKEHVKTISNDLLLSNFFTGNTKK